MKDLESVIVSRARRIESLAKWRARLCRGAYGDGTSATSSLVAQAQLYMRQTRTDDLSGGGGGEEGISQCSETPREGKSGTACEIPRRHGLKSIESSGEKQGEEDKNEEMSLKYGTKPRRVMPGARGLA